MWRLGRLISAFGGTYLLRRLLWVTLLVLACAGKPVFAGPPLQPDASDLVPFGHLRACAFDLSGETLDDTTLTEFSAWKINWRAAPNMQLHRVANMPTDFSPGGTPINSGIPDIKSGRKDRCVKEPKRRAAVGIFPFLDAHAGSRLPIEAAATWSQSSPFPPDKTPQDSWIGSHLWKQARGIKSFLGRHGVTFSGFLQFDSSTVAAGGKPGAIPYDGQYLLDIAVNVDTEKLLGWAGGTFLVDVQTHSGPNILTKQMPSIQDPDNMDAGSFTKVDRAWYRQDFLHQKVQLQGGLMYVDDQFFTVPYGQNFVSLDFSSDSSISTFVLPTYPNGSPGGDVFFFPVKGLYFSAGGFNDHSTELPYDPGGNLYLTEEGWQGSWHERPYKLQVGSWWDTGTFQRFLGGIVHGQASGIYAVASDKLWQPSSSTDRGLGAFFQFGTGPPAVAAVERHYGGGLVWTGPFAARSHDEIGVAFSDSILSPQNDFLHGFENEFEAYYQIHVFGGLTVQPDLEYWQHPGGKSTPNTVLPLVRMQYSF